MRDGLKNVENAAGSMNTSLSPRIKWLDIARGIAMLLVIIGHSAANPAIRRSIYSFHMPLFFILSGMTMSFGHRRSKQSTFRGTAANLLLPLVFLFPVDVVHRYIVLLQNGPVTASEFTLQTILQLFYASAVPLQAGGHTVPAMGIPWFMFVLFWDKMLVSSVQNQAQRWSGGNPGPGWKIVSGLLFVVLTGVSIWLGISGTWLPLDLDLVFPTLCFLLPGLWWMRAHSNLPAEAKRLGKRPLNCAGSDSAHAISMKRSIVSFLVCSGVWAAFLLVQVSLTDRYLDLGGRGYDVFPISFLCAGTGAAMIIAFSRMLETSHIGTVFAFIGRNSIVLFWIHYLDYFYNDWYWKLTDSEPLRIVLRVGTDLAAMMAVLKIMQIMRMRKEKAKNHAA